jgi:hypothetical protein
MNTNNDNSYDDFKSDLDSYVREADLLLAHVVQQGLNIKQDIVNKIVQSKNALQSDQWNPAMETDFWLAYNSIAKLAGPVSVKSLKATTDSFGRLRGGFPFLAKSKRKVSLARKAVIRYRRFFFCALFSLLFIQIFSLIGATATTSIDSLTEKVSVKWAERNKIKVTKGEDAPEIDGLDEDIANYYNRIEASYCVLKKWNNFWKTALNPTRIFLNNNLYPTNMEVMDKHMSVQIAKFALMALQLYLLPLLYGLLGASTYTLRIISHEINTLTYSSESDIRYRSRFYLGALAGMAAGWFFTPETTPSIVKSLSPLALAFLAGYNVEVLFAVMDKFISTFSSGAPKTS